MSESNATPTPRPTSQADGTELTTTDATGTRVTTGTAAGATAETTDDATGGAAPAGGEPAEKPAGKKDDEGSKSTISNVR